MNYYECLGVNKQAGFDEIKKAYRKKSLLHHPDKPNGDAEKFKKINEAYQILSDPQKKNMYDMQQKGGMPGGMPGMPANFHPQDMNDIMSMFFNNNFPQQRQQNNSKFKVFYNGRPVQRKPPEIVEKVTITLEQSYMGGVIPLEINRWIANNNIKTMEKENIYVKFPRGIDNNEMILLKDKGHNLDGMFGDVKIVFSIKNETIFIRKGIDLIFNKTVSLKESLTGMEMNISWRILYADLYRRMKTFGRQMAHYLEARVNSTPFGAFPSANNSFVRLLLSLPYEPSRFTIPSSSAKNSRRAIAGQQRMKKRTPTIFCTNGRGGMGGATA